MIFLSLCLFVFFGSSPAYTSTFVMFLVFNLFHVTCAVFSVNRARLCVAPFGSNLPFTHNDGCAPKPFGGGRDRDFEQVTLLPLLQLT